MDFAEAARATEQFRALRDDYQRARPRLSGRECAKFAGWAIAVLVAERRLHECESVGDLYRVFNALVDANRYTPEQCTAIGGLARTIIDAEARVAVVDDYRRQASHPWN